MPLKIGQSAFISLQWTASFGPISILEEAKQGTAVNGQFRHTPPWIALIITPYLLWQAFFESKMACELREII